MRRVQRPVGPRRRAPPGRSSSGGSRPTPGAPASTGSLLGVAMAEEGQRLFAGALPLDDVESGDIELAGRLAELVDRLTSALCGSRRAQRHRRVGGRAGADRRLADVDVAAATPGSGRSCTRAARRAGRARRTRRAGTAPSPLGLADVRSLLTDRLQGPADEGELPHRPPDGLHPRAHALHPPPGRLPARARRRVFPRHIERDGDDLTARTRTSATATRAAKTASSCSTRCWPHASTSSSPTAATTSAPTSAARRRSRWASCSTSSTARCAPPTDGHATPSSSQHPLQPFDARNFTPGALIPGRPWSFDALNLDGARAALHQRPAPPAVPGPPPGDATSGRRARPARSLPPPPGAGLPARTPRRVAVGPDP